MLRIVVDWRRDMSYFFGEGKFFDAAPTLHDAKDCHVTK